MSNHCASGHFWTNVSEYLKSKPFPLSEGDLRIQLIYDDHLADSREQCRIKFPPVPPTDHNKYPLAKFRTITRLLSETDLAMCVSVRAGAHRKKRADMANLQWVELLAFCRGVGTACLDRADAGIEEYSLTIDSMFQVAHCLLRIRVAILMFRLNLGNGQRVAETSLAAIQQAFGYSAAVLQFPKQSAPARLLAG